MQPANLRHIARKKREYLNEVHEHLRADPALQQRHREKAWTRRFALLEKVLYPIFVCIGLVFGLVSCCFVACLMLGAKEIGAWVGGGVPIRVVVPAMLACWSLFCIVAVLFGSVRIRSEPISSRLPRQTVLLPLPDSKLIRPYLSAGLQIMLPLFVTGLGMFAAVGYIEQWGAVTYLRAGLCVLLSTVCTWLLAEWIAARLLTSQAVSSVAVMGGILLVMVLFVFAGVARDRPELNNESGYGAIYLLPPGGWFLPVSGLLNSAGVRNWLLPACGMALLLVTWRSLQNGLWLADVRLPSNGRVTAYRNNWLRPVPKQSAVGTLFHNKLSIEKQLEAIQQRTDRLLPKSRSILARLMTPLAPSSRQLTCLKLSGIEHARRGDIRDFSFSFMPAVLGCGLVLVNQYVAFYGMPRSLRMMLIFTSLVGLIDLRDVTWQQTTQPSVGLTFFRTLYPFKISELLVALILNRILIIWNALPGLVVLGFCLSLTDAPMDFVVHTIAIVVLATLTLPLFYTIMFCTGNLRTSLRSWMVGMIPAMFTAVVYPLVLMLGVAGGIVTMRVDYAYLALGGSTVLLAAVLFYERFILERGFVDEALKPITIPGVRLSSE